MLLPLTLLLLLLVPLAFLLLSLQCGENLITLAYGSLSAEDCRVPVGYGIIALTPIPRAVLCTSGSYGDTDIRPVSLASKCFSCGANLWTPDQIDGVPATGGFTSDQDCQVKPGFGITETTVDPCRIGFYNPGRNREPCRPCPARFTTMEEESTVEEDCVVEPGWWVMTGPRLY